MRLSILLYYVGLLLTCPAIISTVVLYFYPALFGCGFPAPTLNAKAECIVNGNVACNTTTSQLAPFRLLVLADPQLEGDSSLPDADDPALPHLYNLWIGNYSQDVTIPTAVTRALSGFVIEDIPLLFSAYRKRLDLLGNDFYLAHIYRSLDWWLQPTHVTVLGDLIGSQWVDDEEFERRGSRFWSRVFKHAERIKDEITASTDKVEELGEDPMWRRRLMNIAGNHDVGYAGDLNHDRMIRFERVFGKANWIKTFRLPRDAPSDPDADTTSSPNLIEPSNDNPILRLVILNSMNLDTPVLDPSLQSATYSFINDDVIVPSPPITPSTRGHHLTILLTHIPLYKSAGICTDAPMTLHGPHGISEQNHLSQSSTRNLLEGIFGMNRDASAPAEGRGRPGVILNGHDHTGCDVYHHLDRDNLDSAETPWSATRYTEASHLYTDATLPGMREITVRSMMGEFGGNAGMLSAWFDDTEGEWRFAYQSCRLGVQHFWWAVHVLLVVTVGCWVGASVAFWVERWQRSNVRRTRGKEAGHEKAE